MVVHSFNSIYYPVIVLGIIGAGGVYTGTNPGYTVGEMRHAVGVVGARWVVVEGGLEGVVEGVGMGRDAVWVVDGGWEEEGEKEGGGTGRYRSWRELLTQGERGWRTFTDPAEAHSTAMLCFSSGTTGLPKAARLSHYNLVAQHVLTHEVTPPTHPVRRLSFLPMFHVSTAPLVHISTLRAGHVTYIMRRGDLDAMLTYLPRYAISDMWVVPPVVAALIAHPMSLSEKKACFKRVNCIRSGAAPLDAKTQRRAQEFMPRGAFAQLWGMTETTCVACWVPPGGEDDTGSVGWFLPNLDIKLIDEEGDDVTAYGVRGELCVRGPTVFEGYVGVDRSRDFDAEGYFRTGDVVWGEERTGKWYVVDRKKELIKVRGFQVAPAEVEGVLLEHPGVVDVAVVGVRDEERGSELPRAYVVRKEDGGGLTEGEVERWVEGRLARYKRLEGGVKFVKAGEIPKTASGKIKKRELRERAEREMVLEGRPMRFLNSLL